MFPSDAPSVSASPSVNEYYALYDEITDGGKVMIHDLSDVTQTTLTNLEADARKEYRSTLSTLRMHYHNRPVPSVTTKEDVLCQRIVAPSLQSKHVSPRSSVTDCESRKGLGYPPGISEWLEFQNMVNNYHIEGDLTEHNLISVSSIFRDSLCNAQSDSASESVERIRLLFTLEPILQTSEIVHKIQENYGLSNIIGQVDFCFWKDETTISIVCKTKATHSLQLPITAKKCVEMMTLHQDQHGQKNTQWTNVSHPLILLVSYMIDNNHRYGALTSATKTYFICAMNDGEASRIMITDAWCVGQPNYLRAWAYVHSLGCSDQATWNSPKNWLQSTTSTRNMITPTAWKEFFLRKKVDPTCSTDTDNDNKKRRYTRKNHAWKEFFQRKKDVPTCSTDTNNDNKKRRYTRKNHNMEDCYRIVQQLPMPYVSFEDIVVMNVLGSGRNGCCFRVNWNGQEYAMKQFDIGRDGQDNYTNEILAYMLLREVWGILVPHPIFLSESKSGSRFYLGLQLGRDPYHVDDDILQKFSHVLSCIRKEYGIQHMDAEGRNMIFIPDPNCSGSERIVAIDFEDWEFVND
jgi:hypothetical protein